MPPPPSSPTALIRNRLLFFLFFFGGVALSSAASALVICDDVQEPQTLDPQKEFSEKNHTIIQQIFDGLVRFGPEGEIEPALAVSWERVGVARIRFKLREGVTFHNGEPFDARSVKFSINRYLSPKTGFPALGFIESIKGVDVIDDYTVEVVTRYPDGLLLKRLAGFIVMVPPRYTSDGDEAKLRVLPVGTGPFQFTSWIPGREIQLAANRNYWDARYPKIDSLTFRFIEMKDQVESLLNGEIDILTSLPGTRTLDVQKNSRTKVIKKPSFFTVTGSFNTNRTPLANRRVRQALNLAINKEDLIRYDVLGNGRAIATLSSPGEFGHNSSLIPYPYDPVLAKRILKEEGFPDGLRLKVFLKVNAERTGRIVSRQWEKIGVFVDAVVVTDAELFKYLENKGQWDVLFADCPNTMYHTYFMSTVFFHSNSPFSISTNPEFDERMAEMVSTIDSDDQRALAEKLDEYIFAEALALFTYQRIRTYGLRREVRFTPYKSGMHYFFSTSIDETEPASAR